MKRIIKIWPMVALIMAVLAMTLAFDGCGTPRLATGGAYAPVRTNADGTLTPTQQPDRALFIADSSYKLAYDAIAAVMMFEFQQRAELQKVSPKIKTSLDALRPRVVDIDRRWAQARQAYKVNPVPANLNTVQLVLAEIQQLVPVVQSQLAVKQ
jgi:hypothetical protein